jgi:hypothetical protein
MKTARSMCIDAIEAFEGDWTEPGSDAKEAAMRRLAEAIVRDLHGQDAESIAGDALSLARLVAMPRNFLWLQQDVASFALAVALCAEAPTEELYFPAASTTLAPCFAAAAAKGYANIVPPPPEPARAGVKPGRNELCSCGSGKKFKRCCGS